MESTKRKLDEAHFFLQQVEANSNENPAFDYYLSAFISSARSVLWIMRAEYHAVNGWETWFQSRKPTSDEESFLKKINDIRVYSEKKGVLKTGFKIDLHIPEGGITEEVRHALEKLVGKVVTMDLSPLDNERQSSPEAEEGGLKFEAKVVNVVRALQEPADDDIVDACRKYYHLLEQIVMECEANFG